MAITTHEYIKAPVSTISVGQAASMAALLLASGEKGKDSATNSRIMNTSPWGGYQGQATDIHIHAQEILAHEADAGTDTRRSLRASL